jgi:hypothetical protein
VSDDSFERFSYVFDFLIFEKGDVDFFSKGEIKSAALKIFTEILFEGSNLGYK